MDLSEFSLIFYKNKRVLMLFLLDNTAYTRGREESKFIIPEVEPV